MPDEEQNRRVSRGAESPSGRRHHQRRRRHSSRHRPARRPGDRREEKNLTGLLWAALSVLLVLFGLFVLASSLRKGRRATSPEPSQPSTVKINWPPEHVPTPEDEAARIKEDILTWNQVDYTRSEAERLLKDGLLEQAENSLMRALGQAPDMEALHFLLAKVLTEKALFDEVKVHLRSVLARNPQNEEARIMLATLYSSQANHEAALSVAEWILAGNPYSVAAHRVAAKAFLNTDRAVLAIPHLRRIVTLEGSDVLAENSLAVAYCRTEQYAKASDILNRLLVRDRSNSVTYYNLAVCYAYQAQAENAVETLNSAVTVFGKSFVETWLKSADFDTVRESAPFIAFMNAQGFAQPAADEDPAPPASP